MAGVYSFTSASHSSCESQPARLVEMRAGSGYSCAMALVPVMAWITVCGPRGDVGSCCTIMVRPLTVRMMLVLMLPRYCLSANGLKNSSLAASARALAPIMKSLLSIDTR